MAVFSKPVEKLPTIDSHKVKQFIRQGNDNKATAEFLEQCKKTAAVFKRK